ncbi:glycosyltransferase family protein [Lederbergia sp. NSJ-179]|uniref:cytidylyltransferase domain-containing protein n=1 Tax=Lederbergia sp. NSJ-179 TaxID=2931402 RepID=UPI001FD4EEE1|nr:glycosyltransferase family protein [Lederbergia sp. NSJ-179]MCJ7841377.1 glycosyltransferase family protein [Lederbergia sp. NSJ-179]
MKKIAIIQARMGSTRLPGKVLKEVLNKPLLEYQLERVAKAKKLDGVVIATTTNAQDSAIVKLCGKMGVPVFRGSEKDVLARYFAAASHFQADVIIRLTSDCPVIDPEIIDKVIHAYLVHQNQYDYVSNTIKRTFPRGMDTEVFSYQALQKCHEQAKLKGHREHVTSYMYQHPEQFSLYNVENPIDESAHRWTVDTWDDFLLIKKIIESLYPSQPNFTTADILSTLDLHSEWREINQHVEQKKE